MSVTDNQPTKVGQRVQEVFSDTRGWVVGQKIEDGVPMSRVEWDEPNELDGDWFPDDALRVVEVARIDLDWYNDPGLSPFIEMVSHTDLGPDKTRYTWKNGGVSVGIDAARVSLLTRCVHPERHR